MFWWYWVFIATPRLSLVPVPGGSPLVVVPGPLVTVASLVELGL